LKTHGGDRKSEQVKIKSDNITLDPGRGTSKSYTLSVLKRKAPDMFKAAIKQAVKMTARLMNKMWWGIKMIPHQIH
jgi:hypothetical protein